MCVCMHVLMYVNNAYTCIYECLFLNREIHSKFSIMYHFGYNEIAFFLEGN